MRARQVGLEAIEHRLAPSRRTAARDAGDDAAQRVAVLASDLDGRDHLLGQHRIGTADRRAIHVGARDPLEIRGGHESSHLGHERDDLHAPAHRQQLACDGTCRHPCGRLASTRAAAAAPVADAVLRLVGVVRVARTILRRHLGVVARSARPRSGSGDRSACPSVWPSNTPLRMRTVSDSLRWVTRWLCPGARRSRSGWMSASASGSCGGQPSTTAPSAPPCDSPKVVTRNSVPKVLPTRMPRAAS